jgi:AraC family transcriptional regulator
MLHDIGITRRANHLRRWDTDKAFRSGYGLVGTWGDPHPMSESPFAPAIGPISSNIVERCPTPGGAVTGPLGAKMTELVALGVALAVRCDACVAVHTAAAIRVGSTQNEIAEVFRIAAGHPQVHAIGINPRLVRGGLAPRQMRRIARVLNERLGSKVTLARLAAECGVSVAHFGRAFKQTTGRTPHRWLVEQRVEHAKRLLVTSALPLAEIGATCGFADQSHFTRVFAQLVGSGPGAWRRAWKD